MIENALHQIPREHCPGWDWVPSIDILTFLRAIRNKRVQATGVGSLLAVFLILSLVLTSSMQLVVVQAEVHYPVMYCYDSFGVVDSRCEQIAL